MLKFGQISFLLLFLGLSLFASEPRITNLTATPRYPWNGMVDITYSLEGENADNECSIAFIAYDRNLDCHMKMTSVTGDGVESPVKIGGPYHVVWDSSTDYPSGNSSALKVKGRLGPYMVVNLEDGSIRYTATAPDLTDDTCRTTELWLRYIPAGTFTMGSPEDEVGRFDNETQHQVTLTEDFYIGVFEVTQKQYSLITGGNPSQNIGDTQPVEQISYNTIRGTGAEAGAGWPTYKYVVDDGSFMAKLRALTGLTCDLPTEAQWEYACRAGTTTALNTGKNLTSTTQDSAMDEAGRYHYNRTTRDMHAVVGSYLPNAWGLYDMHGNVLEWCLDWQGDYTGNETDPVGASSGGSRVLRGGCWGGGNFVPDTCAYAQHCRSAWRFANLPYRTYYLVNSDNARYGIFGFRVVFRP